MLLFGVFERLRKPLLPYMWVSASVGVDSVSIIIMDIQVCKAL